MGGRFRIISWLGPANPAHAISMLRPEFGQPLKERTHAMPKLNARELEFLKQRIAALLNCSDLNASLDFVEKMQGKLNRFGIETSISESQMSWLNKLFLEHRIPHPGEMR